MKHFLPVLVFCCFAWASPVEFQLIGPVADSFGDRIDVGSYAAPLFTDWNGDGLDDLLIGQFDGGRIRFYPNSGTPGEPVFDGFQYLLDGGGLLSVPFG